MPKPLLPDSRTENRTISALKSQIEIAKEYPRKLPEGTRTVLGFVLPPFQRGFVWTLDQKIRFVQSMWNGAHLGIYMVNEISDTAAGYEHPFNDVLIDGQQRLKAIEDYWANQFDVQGFFWGDLDEEDRRRFNKIQFGRGKSSIKDEAELRQAYNLLNFGGTPHTEKEKA